MSKGFFCLIRTSGTISIKDTCDSDLNSILTMKSVCQCFGDTFPLVITSTRANGVYMAPAFENNQPLNKKKLDILTIPHAEGGPQGLHTLLIQMSITCSYVKTRRQYT